MSRPYTQSYAPGMSSGRSRGSSLGNGGGYSYTSHTTTINHVDASGRMTQFRDEYTHVNGGSPSSRGHLCTLREEDDYSDSSDEDVGGRFSRMRLADRSDVSRASDCTIRGPRVITLSDEDVDRTLSRCSRARASSRPAESSYSHSRTSSRPTESHYSSSRTDSHRHSTRPSSRPAESHYSSSRPSSRPAESHRPSTRTTTTGSHRPGTRTSSRPAESHYSSSRPAESHSMRPGQELVVYEQPVSRDSGSGTKDKKKARSKTLNGIKALVRNI